MADDVTPARRRRRVHRDDDLEPTAVTADADDLAPVLPELPDADTAPGERGLRGRVGGGSSQVKPVAAMRARDAARARDSDLERSQRELTVVRRHWSPRDYRPQQAVRRA